MHRIGQLRCVVNMMYNRWLWQAFGRWAKVTHFEVQMEVAQRHAHLSSMTCAWYIWCRVLHDKQKLDKGLKHLLLYRKRNALHKFM
jgi:hypothetical protein